MGLREVGALEVGRGISVGRDTGGEMEAGEAVSLFCMSCNVLSSLNGPTLIFMSCFERRVGCIKVQFNALRQRNKFIERIETLRNEHIRHKPL